MGDEDEPSAEPGARAQPERSTTSSEALGDSGVHLPLTRSADPRSAMPSEASPAEPRVRDPERYEVICEHGRGGLGRVSRVHDRELGRDVAIKELLSRGPISEARFAREARITARLEHPGIVPVYEAGRWPDGTPFYAMKLIAGRPLRALIAERKTVDERLGLLHHVIAVAEAMAYAHQHHIIHRDLKPANVIVGDFGETVVIDWGLAKDLSNAEALRREAVSSSPRSGLTTAGSVLGTPAYMPPEQERGEAVDQRADVFAIGAMLWELCSLHKVPPVDRRQRRRLLRQAGIDDDLAAILDKAIDPDPTRRYADAGELAADLKAFKSGMRIGARRYSLLALFKHWTARNRALAVATLMLAGLVIGSSIALSLLYRRALDNEALAEQRAIQAYVEQGRRALLDGEHREALAYLTHALERGDHSPRVRFMLERAAQPLSSSELRLLSGSGRMWAAAFSPDGQQILTADEVGARLWNATTGELQHVLPHEQRVYDARYSVDGARVVTMSADGTVKLWEAASGRLRRTFRASPEADYHAGALSPDGEAVAATDDSTGTTNVWSVRTGDLIVALTNNSRGRSTLAFSADGNWLATASGLDVRVFDARTWKAAPAIAASEVRSLSFDPSGARLVTASWKGDVSVWDVSTGRRTSHLLEIGVACTHVAYSPDGRYLAMAAEDGSGIVWVASTGQVQSTFSTKQRIPWWIEIDPTSSFVAITSAAGRVAVYEVATGLPVTTLDGFAALVSAARFDPRGRRVLAASWDGTARVWPIEQAYRRFISPPVARDCASDVNLEEDRRFVVVNCRSSTRVWDTAQDRLVAELPPRTKTDGQYAADAAVTRAGDRAAIPRGTEVLVYELPSRRLIATIRHPALITSVRFAEDGHALVTARVDGVIEVTSDDVAPRFLKVSSAALDTAAFLPGGRVVATDADRRLWVADLEGGAHLLATALPARTRALRVSTDGGRVIAIPRVGLSASVVLCDLRLGGIVHVLENRKVAVYSAQFVRNDREILTSGADGTANLWDGATGEIRQSFLGTTSTLMAVTMSPDGSTIVGASTDGGLTFWDASTATRIWALRAHPWLLSGLHYEGDDLITRGGWGEIARWALRVRAGSPLAIAHYERLLRCGGMQFNDVVGTLVYRAPQCAVPDR